MLKLRILTSLVLIPLFLAAVFMLSSRHWSLLTLGIISLAAFEWGDICRFSAPLQKAFVGSLLLAGAVITFKIPLNYLSLGINDIMLATTIASVALWSIVIPIWLYYRPNLQQPVLMFVVGFVLLFSTWLAFISLREMSPWFLLIAVVTVWLADSGAYFAGKNFGKHKLAPNISPNKTWEGVAGALIIVSLVGAILCFYYQQHYLLIVFLWWMTIFSVIGDLFESLLKRQANLKDSGHLLPGHGGILDRIDGLLAAMPIAAFIVHFPVYVLLIS